ncbi:hypothetical protein MC885_001620, partial [Smutsia gigantea]
RQERAVSAVSAAADLRGGCRGPRWPSLALAALPFWSPLRAPANSCFDRGGARRVAVETLGPWPARGRAGRPLGSGRLWLRLRPNARSGGAQPVVGPQPRIPSPVRGKMLRRSSENQDAQTRQLQDAVSHKCGETLWKAVCQIFVAYVRKTARLRDKADLLVERLEAKVVEPLKAYGAIVKMKRDDLKATLTSRNREAKQLTQNTSAKPI